MTLDWFGQDMEIVLRVIEILEDLGLAYHLGGSFASSVHGTPRQTRDVDLVVALPLASVLRLASRLQGEFYLDEDRMRSAVREGGEVSDRQWSDVVGLLKTQGKKLDFEYVWRWAEAIHVQDLVRKALEEVGDDDGFVGR